MCDDVQAFVREMQKHDIACDAVQDQGYGLVTQLKLPGGGKLGVYQPRHARPKAMSVRKTAKKPRVRVKKATKKKSKKTRRR